MQNKQFKRSGALLFSALMLFGHTTSAQVPAAALAGIPVLDSTNLAQNIMTAIESVTQTLTQIKQYQTQLNQYENQLKNTLAPATYIWDQAQATIADLMTAVDTLNYYKSQLGSIDKYLAKFQDMNYYRNSPCYTGLGECSPSERASMDERKQFASETQKKANDALLRGLDKQQKQLRLDSRRLERLQVEAQGAEGHMQAIGYANQLASQQANQLLQIRGLLIAQQNAMATRMQAVADKEAQQQAMGKASRESRISPTPNPVNWFETFNK